jgi:hypothetical protein
VGTTPHSPALPSHEEDQPELQSLVMTALGHRLAIRGEYAQRLQFGMRRGKLVRSAATDDVRPVPVDLCLLRLSPS